MTQRFSSLGIIILTMPIIVQSPEAAVTAVFPSAPTRPIFSELLDEGLEPHQVKELYITHSTSGTTVHVDIEPVIDRKIEALRCHKSQLDPGDGAWIREWAAETGKDVGLTFAESLCY